MQFAYVDYYRRCFADPMCTTIFFVIWLLIVSIPFFKSLLSREAGVKEIGHYAVGFLIGVYILSIGIGRLANGGIHLLYEKEADAVSVCGRMEQIEALNRFSFAQVGDMEYTQQGVYGIRVTIDGSRYTVIGLGDLQVGDTVRIVYLPESRYVLEIDKIDERNPGTRSGPPQEVPTASCGPISDRKRYLRWRNVTGSQSSQLDRIGSAL